MNENLVTHSEEMEFIDGNVTNSSPTLTINLPNHIISTNWTDTNNHIMK